MGPGDLEKALAGLPREVSDELLVGFEHSDDAAVYRFSDDCTLIQTVDFFTPVVDTPYLFGQISAANSLSDIYAMGGEPVTVMNLVGFPCHLDLSVLGEILRGGAEKVREAGAVIVGGHTVQDDEPKYGMAVTGRVIDGRFTTNAACRPGDRLVLTKRLGIGVLSTALKGGLIGEDDMMPAIDEARMLNRAAAEAMREVGAHACTDVTGFGLAGHLKLMLEASGASARLFGDALPIWENALEFAATGVIPGGAHDNEKYLASWIDVGGMHDTRKEFLFDPQTSGGLIISVASERETELLAALESRGVATRAVIGEVFDGPAGHIAIC